MGHGELQNYTASVSVQYIFHLGSTLEFHKGHSCQKMGLLGIIGLGLSSAGICYTRCENDQVKLYPALLASCPGHLREM